MIIKRIWKGSNWTYPKMDQTHNFEQRTELINVRHTEPDPALFQLPPDYEALPLSTKSTPSVP